ncbi:uncharacterized protein LOC144107659 isoform X1 [Amblyomma americanum]
MRVLHFALSFDAVVEHSNPPAAPSNGHASAGPTGTMVALAPSTHFRVHYVPLWRVKLEPVEQQNSQQAEKHASPSVAGTVMSRSVAPAHDSGDRKPGHLQNEPSSDGINTLGEEDSSSKKESPYKCAVCPKSFQEPAMLASHLTVLRTEEKRHKCHLCTKSFHKGRDLRTHLLGHEGRKPFHCHLCPAKFVARNYLADHLQRHKSTKRFKCDLCPKSFLRPGHLAQHIARYHACASEDTVGDCKVIVKRLLSDSQASM